MCWELGIHWAILVKRRQFFKVVKTAPEILLTSDNYGACSLIIS